MSVTRFAARQWLSVVLVCVLLVGLSGSAIAADAGSLPSDNDQSVALAGPGTTLDVLTLAAQETDNKTDRHENPDEYDEQGDEDSVRSWLSGRLADRLGSSTIQLSEGQYDKARGILGDEYDSQLEQYVDVAGETDGETARERFNETRNAQTRLANTLEEYERTREAYEEALAAGETERARELARELVALAEEMDSVSEQLVDLYAEIEEIADVDLSEASEGLNTTTAEVRSETEDIRSAEFIETNLIVSSQTESISFFDPLTATGRLETADGKEIANESIRLAVGDQQITAQTDADGAFAFEYRPVTIPANTSELTVQYVPDGDSVYLGNSTTLTVAISQVTPRLAGLSVPEEFAYAETAQVRGDVLVEEIPVSSLSIEVLVDGQRLGTTVVQNGSFNTSVSLPASISDGEQSLTIRVPEKGLAIGGATLTRQAFVQETDTTLTINATETTGGEIEVTGSFRTADGTGIGGEQIDISLDGASAGTARTTANGNFVATVSPESIEGEEQMSLRVAYDGTSSNLAAAAAERTITVGAPRSSTTDSPSAAVLVALLGGGVIFLGGGGVLWLVRTRPIDEIPLSGFQQVRTVLVALNRIVDSPEPESVAIESPSGSGITEQSPEPQTADSLFERASEQLQNGRPDRAVQATYLAVRYDLETRLGTTAPLTHWEFYQQYRDAVNDSSADSLQSLTEAYERATFSGDSISANSAREILVEAQQLCQSERSGFSIGHDDD